jgi:hypothetical protein
VPEDVWYIVPVHVFTHIRAIRFFPFGKRGISRYEKYRDAWCLMACPNDGPCKRQSSESDDLTCPRNQRETIANGP